MTTDGNEPGFFGSFMDVTASDIIGAYVKKEQLENEYKLKQIQQQSANQQATLHRPNYDTMQDAVNSGYAPYPNGGDYWDRIPKPLLYGSLGLLGAALLIKAAKS